MEDGEKKVKVTTSNLEEFLGKQKYTDLKKNSHDEVGIVRGLAWTSVGGDTLQVEVNIMPGKGGLLLTGKLGDVMKESAQAGVSYIRSIIDKYGVDKKFFTENDIHIHVPEGAVPKDGPSAGITMATAMFSAITGRKVRSDVAMTGEITLRGRVLPVGGLKEKLLAAKTAGMKTVIVPAQNRPDIEELSEEITGGMEIVYADSMSTVVKTAVIEEPAKAKKPGRPRKAKPEEAKETEGEEAKEAKPAKAKKPGRPRKAKPEEAKETEGEEAKEAKPAKAKKPGRRSKK